MTREDSLKIIKRLYGAFLYTQKLDQDYVRDEYINTLKNVSESDCSESINDMIMSNKKELPTPGELLEACKTLENERKSQVQPETMCFVCEDRGFISFTKHDHEYVLFCTECDKGNDFNYQGKNCKHKSEYFIEPVTKYFDIEELKARNMFKNREAVPCPTELKQQLLKIGVRV